MELRKAPLPEREIVDIGKPVYDLIETKRTLSKVLTGLLVNEEKLIVACAYYARHDNPCINSRVVAVECVDSNGGRQVYAIDEDLKIKDLDKVWLWYELGVPYKTYLNY